MSNEIQLAEKLPIENMADMHSMATVMAQSNVFGTKNVGDCFFIAMTCQQKRMAAIDFQATYHMIKGKPSKKAEAMLISLEELGGNYKILSRTGDKAEIEVEYRNRKFKDSFTWEEAQKEKYIYQNDGNLKNTWSTPRGRSQMLWSRVVSNAIGVVCPKARAGTYTPEEVMDFVEETEKVVSPSKPTPMPTEKVKAVMKEAEVVIEAKAGPAREPIEEPCPFNKQLAEYLVCPIPGQMQNIKWADMPLETLKIAQKMKHESLMTGHFKAIDEAVKAIELANMPEKDVLK